MNFLKLHNRLQFHTMVNAREVSNCLDAHIEENNKRLQNLEDTIAGLSLQMQDVRATLKAISDRLGFASRMMPEK